MSAANFGEWDVANLRLTVFYIGKPVRAGLWRRLVGMPPESSETREREGVVNEQGIVEDGNVLHLGIQSARLDWNFHPSPIQPDIGGAPPAAPSLAAVGHAVSILRQALDVSIAVCDRVDRVALGSVLIKQEVNQSDSLEWLAKYLPHLSLDSHEGEGFVFQINRRRRSEQVSHVRVNRIARWQQETLLGMRGTIAVGSGAPQSNVEARTQGFISKLTIDVNTVPGSNAISKDRLPGLFEEFVSLTQEIAIKGDIP